MEPARDLHSQPRACVRYRARSALNVGERTLVGGFVQQVHLQLGNPARVGFVPQSDAYGGRVAGTIVVAWPVHMVPYGALELSVDEHVEVLTDRPIVVSADDDIGAAGAGLQTGIERRSHIRASIEVDRGAVVPGGQLDAELNAEVPGRQQSLIAADEPNVPEA